MDPYVGTTEKEAKSTHVQSETLLPNKESDEVARSTHVQSMTLPQNTEPPTTPPDQDPFLRTIRQNFIREQ